MTSEADVQRAICDYYDCSKLVREEDMEFTPPTKRYCQKHGAELDSVFDEDDMGKVLGWWVKSMGGAKEATKGFI